MIKNAIYDVLLECKNRGIKDPTVIKNVISEMYKDGVISMTDSSRDRLFNGPLSSVATLNGTYNKITKNESPYAKYATKQPVPAKYLAMLNSNAITATAKPIRKTKAKTSVAVTQTSQNTVTATVNNTAQSAANNLTHHTAAGKISLRTVLTNYGQNGIYSYNVIFPEIQRMENDGEITAGSAAFIQKTFNGNAAMFKQTIINCIQGKSWASQPLTAFPNFIKYIPKQYMPQYAKNNCKTLTTNNVRTVISILYSKGKLTNALSVAATLADLTNAGFTNMNYYSIPGLVNMTQQQLDDLGKAAKKGTGIFKGQKIVRDDVLKAIL